jgi:hypothetical protein
MSYGNKEIAEFHDQLEKMLLPELLKHGFEISSHEVDQSIGSYHLKLTKGTDKELHIHFCMHHLDLFDGVYVELKEGGITTLLNDLFGESRKIYSQLRPVASLTAIKYDLLEKTEVFLN